MAAGLTDLFEMFLIFGAFNGTEGEVTPAMIVNKVSI
jgi:hypothetical protein